MEKRFRWSYYLVIALLLLPWIANGIYAESSPLYLDSIFTFGAGAKLYLTGHHSTTFMLYGLINPYILERFLVSGLGPDAPVALRLTQLLYVFGAMWLCGCCVNQIVTEQTRKRSILTTFMVMLSSTVLLRESLEVVPEPGLLLSLALLMYAALKPHTKYYSAELLAGFSIGLMTGFRPVGFLLAIPFFLILPDKFSGESGAKTWRWGLLTTACLIPVLMSVRDAVPFTGLVTTVTILFCVWTVLFLILDIVKGKWKVWAGNAVAVITAIAVIYAFFPQYFNHFDIMLEQINSYHTQRENPVGSIPGLLWNLLISLAYLVIAFPGPLGFAGILVFLGMLFRQRQLAGGRTILLVFAGLMPFVLTVCRNTNYQSRYLIPVSAFFAVISAIGFLRIADQRKFHVLLLVPLLLSVTQLGETLLNMSSAGSILTTLRELSDHPPGTVTVLNIGPCTPDYYDEIDPVFYPLIPYVSPCYHRASPLNSMYCVSFGELPEGFIHVSSNGYIDMENEMMIRNSENKRWSGFISAVHKPHLWRNWGISILGVRADG